MIPLETSRVPSAVAVRLGATRARPPRGNDSVARTDAPTLPRSGRAAHRHTGRYCGAADCAEGAVCPRSDDTKRRALVGDAATRRRTGDDGGGQPKGRSAACLQRGKRRFKRFENAASPQPWAVASTLRASRQASRALHQRPTAGTLRYPAVILARSCPSNSSPCRRSFSPSLPPFLTLAPTATVSPTARTRPISPPAPVGRALTATPFLPLRLLHLNSHFPCPLRARRRYIRPSLPRTLLRSKPLRAHHHRICFHHGFD